MASPNSGPKVAANPTDLVYATNSCIWPTSKVSTLGYTAEEDRMSKRFIYLFTALVNISLGVTAQGEEQSDLIYVAVDPCRIADTRQSSLGVIRADTLRNFRVAGSSSELGVNMTLPSCASSTRELELLCIGKDSLWRTHPSLRNPPLPQTF